MLHTVRAVHAAKHVLLPLLGHQGRLLTCPQHHVVCDQLYCGCVGWAPAFEECAALQKKTGEVARGMTCSEWCLTLSEIIQNARKLWQQANPDRPFGECIFMYDNPSFHNISEEDKQWLLETPGLLERIDQLQRPPPYSGDFMQCIEHVHAVICDRWWYHRFRNGTPSSVAEQENQLYQIFWDVINPKGVTANCDKVWDLINYVVEQDTGDYAPPSMV